MRPNTPTPQDAITIRPAQPADAGEYLQLVDALARYERMPLLDASAKVRLVDHLFGQRPYYKLLVAEDTTTGHLVGYAAWFLSYSTFMARPAVSFRPARRRPSPKAAGAWIS